MVKRTFPHTIISMIGLICLSVALGDRALAGSRFALVIGNGAYQATSPLNNPPNDANLMAETLADKGFEVTKLIDASQREMRKAMLEFGRALRSGDAEAGLFYYAGHGVQVKGENYLIPVNAQIEAEDEIELEGINVNDFLRVMDTSASDINIVILDACRNNPFARSFRSAARGLATVDAPKGTLIAYSTAPGDVALDGEGQNSPYTTELARSISQLGNQPIESVFKTTRKRVLERTGDKQLPWETSSVVGDFYFNADRASSDLQENDLSRLTPNLSPEENLVQAFEAARKDGTASGWQSFIERHGEDRDNFYVQSALEQLAALSKPEIEHAPSPVSRSWKCTGQNRLLLNGRLCVSSILDPQYGNRYGGINLIDNNLSTAWVEGKKGDGLGEGITIEFSQPTSVSQIELRNGYNKRKDLYVKNSRVSDLRVEMSDGFTSSFALSDRGTWQRIDIPSTNLVNWIKISIGGVFRGTKYRDTAITELRVK